MRATTEELLATIKESAARLYGFADPSVHPSILANELWLLNQAATEWDARRRPATTGTGETHTPDAQPQDRHTVAPRRTA
jgi:hypothetical protein